MNEYLAHCELNCVEGRTAFYYGNKYSFIYRESKYIVTDDWGNESLFTESEFEVFFKVV